MLTHNCLYIIYIHCILTDFDEQTTDDLDVDFSAYEEPGAGDKDIKDFLKIRQEQRYVICHSYKKK